MTSNPILFLIFNRPDLTEIVFGRIREARPLKLYIAADGPRPHKAGEAEICQRTREAVLSNIDWDCEVHTLLRDNNLGCKNAVSGAITWFFEKETQGIILEDDTLPDLSFFSFCDEMLEKYKDESRVTQIGGVNLMDRNTETDKSYFYSKVGGIWGWASWRRVWQNYDVTIAQWAKEESKTIIKKHLGEKEWFAKLEGSFNCVHSGELDTWDYQWVFTQLLLSGMAIIPSVNLVENLGFRSDATHTTHPNELVMKLRAGKLAFPLKHPDRLLPNKVYESYYFSLVNAPDSRLANLLRELKYKVRNVFRKSN